MGIVSFFMTCGVLFFVSKKITTCSFVRRRVINYTTYLRVCTCTRMYVRVHTYNNQEAYSYLYTYGILHSSVQYEYVVECIAQKKKEKELICWMMLLDGFMKEVDGGNEAKGDNISK